ncbi:MAG TPA: DUF4037 domain-containing protein [Spirochaetia bacterium]|nr:DUF4037 domain-containing protein [Spirochaetia bacterium]
MSEPGGFIPGLVLGRALFQEAGRAIIESVVAPGSYAAAFVGKGSDVLGFDTERSTDHDWGPRFQVFIPTTGFAETSPRLHEELQRRLPPVFRGFDVGFAEPDLEDHGTRVPAHAAEGSVPHKIEITTLPAWLHRHLGVHDVAGLSLADWLVFPEQRLLEVTAGEVFHDPDGALTRARAALREYPRDVWLYRMACQWQRLSQAEAFIGRCAEVGDVAGMKIVAARVLKDVMKLCFLMERCYAPYDKWLGTAFHRLSCGPALEGRIAAALAAPTYEALEPPLVEIYRALGEMHNRLSVTGPMDPSPRQFWSRPYTVMRSDRFANALLGALASEELRRLPVRMGGIDQLVDNTDFIENPTVYGKLRGLYQ